MRALIRNYLRIMNNKTFTIHTELIDGSLEGARNIYMGANSTCHLYVIPRQEINLANSITEIAGQHAFYVLMGGNKAYIGQTSDFANRKNDHMQKKDWWDTALVFISDNQKIYGDDIRFLENLGINSAIEASRCELLNNANPKRPNIAPFRVNDMEVFFRDIELLARFYGCDIFTKKVEPLKLQDIHIYETSSSERPSHGKAYYNEEIGKLILMEGSQLATVTVPSFKSVDARDKFISEHCKTTDGKIILKHDVPMDSASQASGYILGRPSNGYADWKDADGRCLPKP